MELKSSSVHRHLEVKWKIGPFEGLDLLIILIIASSMNLIFGNSRIGFYMVFVLPSILAIILYLGKRGKPEGYLFHLLKYLTSKGHFLAGSECSKRNFKLHRIIQRKRNKS